MFIFPDDTNISSNNINVNHENVQMTEVKNKSDGFNFADKFTKMTYNNSTHDKVASKSMKISSIS